MNFTNTLYLTEWKPPQQPSSSYAKKERLKLRGKSLLHFVVSAPKYVIHKNTRIA